MTVEASTSRVQYGTNGTTGPWSVPFKFLDDSHLEVIHTDEDGIETTLVLDTDYSVTGAGDESGTVTTDEAFASGGTITVLRGLPFTQDTDYGENDSFPAETHERRLDWLTMLGQQLHEVIARALVFSPSDQNVEPLPPAAARALRSIGFDADGALTLNIPTEGTAAALALALASSLLDIQGPGMIGWRQAGAGAVARTLLEKLREMPVSVTDFGAVADGATDGSGTDNYAAFAAAIATGRNVEVPPGSYLINGKLEINNAGQKIYGPDGGNQVELIFAHTSLACFRLLQPRITVNDLIITATDARNAAAYSAGGHGIHLASATGATFLTCPQLNRNVVTRQPGEALHGSGEFLGLVADQNFMTYNRGHGYFMDDGTLDGQSTLRRPGVIWIGNGRSSGNGGNAINLAQGAGGTVYRVRIENMDCGDCGWNSANISGLLNYQYYIRAQNVTMSQCAAGDVNYAATTQPNGDTRTAKGSASKSVFLASNSKAFVMENTRHLEVNGSLVTGDNIDGIYVRGNYSSNVQPVGYDIGASCVGVDIEMSEAGQYTIPCISASAGGKLRVGDKDYILQIGSANTHFLLRGVQSPAPTVATGFLQIRAELVEPAGEGGAADDIVTGTYTNPGSFLSDGLRFVIRNPNAGYDLTIKHGTGNIRTKSGSDVVLSLNECISLMSRSNLLLEV